MLINKPGGGFQALLIAAFVIGGTMESAFLIYPLFLIILFFCLYGMSVSLFITSKLFGSKKSTKGIISDLAIFLGILVVFGFICNSFRGEIIGEISIPKVVSIILDSDFSFMMIQLAIIVFCLIWPFYEVIKHIVGNYRLLKKAPKLPQYIDCRLSQIEGRMITYKARVLALLPYPNHKNDEL